MRPKKMKLLAGILAVMLCMATFSVTTFASGDDWCEYGDYGTPEALESASATETPSSSPEVTPTPDEDEDYAYEKDDEPDEQNEGD